MAHDQPTSKGSILRSLLKFVRNELSEHEWAEVLRTLSEADRQLVERGRILATEKVSEFLLNQITSAAANAKGESVDSFGRRAGRAELADAVGVYRFFTLLLTPAALLQKASVLWSTIHSHGQLLVEKESSSAVVRLVQFPSEAAHCARLTGWFEGAGELTGAKSISVIHAVCMTGNANECVWQLSWTK